MEASRRWLVIALVGIAACGDDEQDPEVVLSTTDGAGDTGDDEGCLMEPRAGRSGFRYQCEGSIAIDLVVEGPFDGSPTTSSMQLAFGHSVRGDTYDEPHVMACCPEYDPDVPSCEQGHEQACMADLAEQGCKSMEVNLRNFADEHYGGAGLQDTAARSAINKIADHVQSHQGDCIAEFIENTGVASIEPSCDPDGTGVEYDELLESGQWSFDPEGLVDLVTISVATASWTGIYPTGGAAESCTSADDNDGVLFFEVDPKPGSKRLQMAQGTAVLHGPSNEIMGTAELESAAVGCAPERCSRIDVAIDRVEGTASLEDMQIRLAGTAAVGEPSAAVTVDALQVRLWDATRARLDEAGTTVVIPPGGAWFVVSAAAGDLRGVVSATNETAIVMHEGETGWTSSGFTIAKRDAAGERWALAVMPATWQ